MMKKKGYLLFCRTVELKSNSNETKVEMVEYVDKVMGFFDREGPAIAMARTDMDLDKLTAKCDKSQKIREFIITDDMLTGYEFDGKGCLDEVIKDTIYPYIQIKSKPNKGKKTIIERSMYIVSCNHYV